MSPIWRILPLCKWPKIDYLKGETMPLSNNVKQSVYDYCSRDLPSTEWYENEFDFIEDMALRKRIIEEFKGIRFAYKLYEGIEAQDENIIFEIRHQIFAYATIYEAVIHYLLYTYYDQTKEFHELKYHETLAKISIPPAKLKILENSLEHDGKVIVPMYMKERQKDDAQIRFEDKCRAAERLGLLQKFINGEGKEIDLPSEIIEIYSYRNAIHLVAEQRKGVEYELELSKRAYRRMRPFIDQIKSGLQRDQKGIYTDCR